MSDTTRDKGLDAVELTITLCEMVMKFSVKVSEIRVVRRLLFLTMYYIVALPSLTRPDSCHAKLVT